MTHTNADRLRAEALLEIRDLATTLCQKIDEMVPDKPTYWEGTPEGYLFPLSGTDFTWLWATLNAVIGNLTPDYDWIDDDGDDVEALLAHISDRKWFSISN